MSIHMSLASEQKAQLESAPNNETLLIIGGVARNEYTQNSDLDLLLITKDAPEQNFEEYIRNDVTVEIKKNSLEYYLNKIESDPQNAYQFLDVIVLFDKENNAEKLKKRANEILENYVPTNPSGLVKWLSSVSEKIQNGKINNDVNYQGYQASNVLWKIVQSLYTINKLPTPPATLAYRNLKALDILPNDFDRTWSDICSGNFDARVDKTVYLLEYCVQELNRL